MLAIASESLLSARGEVAAFVGLGIARMHRWRAGAAFENEMA